MFRLRVVPAQGEPFEHPLEEDSLLVGRASECGLVIADRFLSRRHARIYRDGDRWMVEDLGSRNGTLVNHTRIEEPRELKEGDQLKLSGSLITLGNARQPAQTERGSQATDISAHTIFRRASELIDSAADQTRSDPASLQRYTERLRMLNDVHQALGRSIELSDLLDLILDRAFNHLQPEEGVIYLRQPGGEYERAAFRSAEPGDREHLYSSTLVHEVGDKGLAALVLDVESDQRFAAAESILASGVRSLVAAPLLDGDSSLGVMALSSRANRRQFAEEDMELLVSLASVAALRIRNVSLAEDAAERRRLEKELRLARQIQVTLLPEKLPEIEGYDLHAGNIPSLGVSGDYYVVVERAEGKECVLMLADVSGKGIAASLLTASLEALAAGPIETGASPERICKLVSRRLYARTPPAKYATAFVASLESASGRFRFSNAGHNQGLRVAADGSTVELGTTGLPIGLLDGAEYTGEDLQLEPGHSVVLYTDGITEATNAEDEEYGLERLRAVCARNATLAPAELAKEIERDLDRFVDGVPFADDRTVLILRRRP